jgi:hypothetical protein
MRRAVVLCLAAGLALPAVAAAVLPLALGDGTLAVRSGDGLVKLNLRSGITLGRAVGTLEVLNPDVDCSDLSVWNWDTEIATKRDSCVFKSSEDPIRFRLTDGEDVRVTGHGIWLSVVGRGKAWLEGSDTKVRDGQYSLNGAPFKSLPDDGRMFVIGGS